MEYTKQPITLAEQIEILKKRGLIFDDEKEAIGVLQRISYFRLAAYWRLMEADSSRHDFREGSHFTTALSLYRFDNDLKALLFRAIQTIEVAVRTQMIQHFSMKYGAFWFMQAELFSSADIYQKHMKSLRRALERTQDDFIMEHFRRYDTPDMPPAWKTMELTTLGTLSRMYSNFSDNSVKKQVARNLGIPQHEFMRNWLEILTIIRNNCAHHARMWNRRFVVRLRLPHHLPFPWIQDSAFPIDRLYPQLCCIAYWLNRIEPQNTFVHDFRALLRRYPDVKVTAMGFPANWQEEPLWTL